VNPSRDTLIGAAMVFLAVSLGTISLALLWEWLVERRQRYLINRQLDLVRAAEEAAGAGGLLRSPAPGALDPLLTLARRIPRLNTVETMLEQADISWSFGTFLLLSVGFAGGTALALMAVTGWWLPAAIGGFLGLLAPYVYIARARAARLLAFEEGLPEALELLSRAVRAGHPIAAGIKLVADESPEPIQGEFQRSFEEQRFGIPFEDTLRSLSARVPLIDLRMLVTAVLIQREVGGNLAEVLDNLADVIRQRFTVRRQLRVHTAQGRLSGYVLAALPIVVGFLIYLINPEYVSVLGTHPFGRLMLGIAISLQLMGLFWIRRIIAIDI
jgi:tight adherence protein B